MVMVVWPLRGLSTWEKVGRLFLCINNHSPIMCNCISLLQCILIENAVVYMKVQIQNIAIEKFHILSYWGV